MAITRRLAIRTGAQFMLAGWAGVRLSETAPAAPRRTGWHESLRALGASYLAQQRAAVGDVSVDACLGVLQVSEESARDLMRASLAERARRIRDDFDGGRTVIVHGWVLSASEVAAAVVAAEDARL